VTIQNPALPGTAAMAEGNGWSVIKGQAGTAIYIARDDGVTFLGITLDRLNFNRARAAAILNASPGISTPEKARVAACIGASW
jgi:hypothetical protein